MSDIAQIGNFILKHYPPAREWDRKTLIQWLDWHWQRKMIAVIRLRKQIVGLAVARIISDLSQVEDHYAFEPEGNILLVELSIRKHPKTYHLAIEKFISNYGPKKKIAHQRYHRGQTKLWVFDFDKMKSRLANL